MSRNNEPKQNWFGSLVDALMSEGLQDLWPWDSSIAYGQNVRHIVEHDGVTRLISVYRETDGRYERPIHYITNVDKKERDVYLDAARYRYLRKVRLVVDESVDEMMKQGKTINCA